MGILCGAGELVTAFIGLEMSSISSYILAGFRRDAIKSNEASLKYFLLGSFATAFFLYGTAMIYGATGTTRFDGIETAVGRAGTLLVLGLALLFVGLGFKIVAAPFQIYAPDVYEGAPTPVSALLASGPKAATFARDAADFLRGVRRIRTALVLGDLDCRGAFDVRGEFRRAGANQREAHAGLFLDRARGLHPGGVRGQHESGNRGGAVLPGGVRADEAGGVCGRGAFGGAGEKRLEIKDYAGLSTQQPWLAACFALFVFSAWNPRNGRISGEVLCIPGAAGRAFIIWLVIIAALNSIVGYYYYCE